MSTLYSNILQGSTPIQTELVNDLSVLQNNHFFSAVIARSFDRRKEVKVASRKSEKKIL